MFNKGGNIIFEGMKIFQVKENKPQQISIFPMKVIKGLQKNGIIHAIKHVFVWCIVYKQHVANVNVKKKTSRFLWKIGLLGLLGKKCKFCM
jgi:hypothetical protein